MLKTKPKNKKYSQIEDSENNQQIFKPPKQSVKNLLRKSNKKNKNSPKYSIKSYLLDNT